MRHRQITQCVDNIGRAFKLLGHQFKTMRGASDKRSLLLGACMGPICNNGGSGEGSHFTSRTESSPSVEGVRILVGSFRERDEDTE